MHDTDLIVVALGGNALSPEDESGDVAHQFIHTQATADHVAALAAEGHRLVFTHGNGPQVGAALRRVEIAAREVYRLPLYICVADTQGGMGFMIATHLNHALAKRGLHRRAVAVVTTVEVDPADPAFGAPDKPIGPFYDDPDVVALHRRRGWHMVEIHGHGFRRVVPSPQPRQIGEAKLIQRLAAAGELVICCGGGGVPVVRGTEGQLSGVDAVIDKDRTSALLAGQIDAALLMIVTGVESVALDFGTDRQRRLAQMTLADARRHHADGQFPAGSMGPKIEAAIAFLEHSQRPDASVVICDVEHMVAALRGESGTRIKRG